MGSTYSRSSILSLLVYSRILGNWLKNKKLCMAFVVPMVWW